MTERKRKSVTMKDIADKIGISKNAVSLALSGKVGVSEHMREEIRKTAKELGYFDDVTSLVENRAVVVLVPAYIRDDGSFYSDIFWSIEHECRSMKITAITCGIGKEAERDLIPPKLPEGLNIIGYLAVGIISKNYLEMLKMTGVNIVSVDIRTSMNISSVSADNIYAGQTATEYLIEHGHTKIGFIGPVYSAESVFERYCGYQRALMYHGIAADKGCEILGKKDGFELLDNENVLAEYFGKIGKTPTAWFCAGDMIAVALYRILSAKGVRIPDDVSIVGCDDLKISEYIDPPLTTIHIERKKLGKLAMRQLLHQADATEAPSLQTMLPCSLTIRKSVKRLS